MYCAMGPVAITIWALCYRKHVGICVNTSFGTTHKDNDLEKCDILLVYREYNIYEDTRVMTHEEYPCFKDAIASTQPGK